MVSALFVLAQLVIGAAPTPDLHAPIVSGRVIDADSGHPVAGALVTPYGSAVVAPGTVILTNGTGQFAIRGLRAGSLVVIARKGGYIDAARGQTRPAGVSLPLRVAADGRYADIDVRMWRHGVITGTVVDEGGDPVIGATVRAYKGVKAGGRSTYSESGSATTDDRGVYRIAQLVPGNYLVGFVVKQTSIPADVMDVFFGGASTRAERDALGREMKSIDAAVVPAGSRYATSVDAVTMPLDPGTATPTSRGDGFFVYPTMFHPSARTPAEAAPVVVRSGLERANIDLQLRLERTVRVSGMLVAPDGLAAHVPVRLTAAGDDTIGPLDVAVTMTDATGAFTFAGVTPGQYVLSAVRLPRPPPDPPNDSTMTIQAGAAAIAPRPPPASALAPPPPVPADATLSARLPIAVGEGDVTDANVPLQEAPRMSGRLEFDGVADPPDPTLVANLRIQLVPSDGSPAGAGLAQESGHPDGFGGFTTVGVPSGRYIVQVNGLPLPGWTFKGAQFEGRDLADTPIDLTRDVTGVVLSFTDRPASIDGTVRSGMRPDPEAVIAAYPVDEAAWSDAGPAARRIKVAHAAADGTFTIANVPAGDYYVVAVTEDPPSWQDPALLRALAPAARQVRVLDGGRSAVTLRTVAAK